MGLPVAVDAIRPSIVQICVRIGREVPRALGTGFIVDERGTVVTAWHVFEEGMRRAQAAGNSHPQFVAAVAHPNPL